MLATKKCLTIAAAKRIAAAAQKECVKNNWTMFIAIVDDGGNLMYLERMDGTQLGSLQVSIEKGPSIPSSASSAARAQRGARQS